MVIDDIQHMIAGKDLHPMNRLLEEIKAEAGPLIRQLTNFKNEIRDRKIISFYETEQTRRLELVRYLLC